MRFINQTQIINNGSNKIYRHLRRDSLKILEATLLSIDPKKAISNMVKREGNLLIIKNISYDLEKYNRILVIGGGKAGGRMAEAIEDLLGDLIYEGSINIPRSQNQYSLKQIKLNQCSHPIPDIDGVKGVKKILDIIKGSSEKDLIICLLSGGGSALMPLPVEGIDLKDLQEITSILLKNGATINDINVVRKHLDGFKGGQLLRSCRKSDVLTLIISDVIGDPLDIIASGPTAPDNSTYNDAIFILKKFGAWTSAPDNIIKWLEKGVQGKIAETPKPDDPLFKKVQNIIVANNLIALETAQNEAKKLGYNSLILSSSIEGEAKIIGGIYASIAREIVLNNRPIQLPAAIIAGGETTVKVHGPGKGGRNQELVLGAVKKITDLPCLIISIGTDGIDGPTDSAGGLVDGATLSRSQKIGINLDLTMSENDSYNYLDKLGDLIKTGVTGTNVNDIHLLLLSGDC
jgi:glycerate-2-kinase